MKVPLNKAILLVIDGMDTVNFTMAHAPCMSGLHGKTAVGVAHTEIIGAGAAITPIAHGMMGTGYNVIAHRPGRQATGRPYDYFGMPIETIGDVARQSGMKTAAVGKNEAAIVLGGIDCLEHRRLEMDGINAGDDQLIAQEVLETLAKMDRGILVANYAGVDLAGHARNVEGVIQGVERADGIVAQLLSKLDLTQTLLVITADHGTNPFTGNHNTAPTPLCLIADFVRDRVNLGVCHTMEIAVTIAAALGLPKPKYALGRNLLQHAIEDGPEKSYHSTLKNQLEALYLSEKPRHHQN